MEVGKDYMNAVFVVKIEVIQRKILGKLKISILKITSNNSLKISLNLE